SGHAAVAQSLLAAKADPDATDPIGDTPLHRAAEKASGAGIDVLIAAGARPDLRNNDGKTALELAIGQMSAETVAALLRGKADPNLPFANRWTPLYDAVSRQRQDL